MSDPAETNEAPENVVPITDGKAAEAGKTDGKGDAKSDDKLTALEAQAAEYKDQALRAMAEAENTRRRAQKEREDATKYAVTSFAKELVGVSDNLHRALEAAGTPADEKMKVLVQGIEGIERQLQGAFDRVGIKKLEPLGEAFDPNFHRVMLETENSGKAAGTVTQVLQAGYVIHDRLLREALVAVAKGEGGDKGSANSQMDQTA